MTKTQLIGQKEVSSKTGIIVVAASLAALYLDALLVNLLSSIGLPALVTDIVFWGIGGGIAALVYYNFAMRYLYTADGVKLIVERIYHRKPRPMVSIMKRDILFTGTREEAEKKHGKLKTHKAIRRTNANKPVAVVYKCAGEKQMLIIQPNEEILKAIEER